MVRDPIIPRPGCDAGALVLEPGQHMWLLTTAETQIWLSEDDLRELYHPSVVAEVQRRLGIKGDGR